MGEMANERSTRSEFERRREVDWVARVRSGDQRAYAELYETYAARIRGFICRRIQDRAEADDLTQETFFQLYRSFQAYDGRASLLTWTFGIARNVCSHYLRHRSRWMIGAGTVLEVDDRATDAAIESHVDAARALARCDAVLASRRRPSHETIFRLRYAEGRSVRSIAEHVGKTSRAVKVSLRLSRHRLVDEVPELVSVLGDVSRSAGVRAVRGDRPTSLKTRGPLLRRSSPSP